MSTVHAYTNDQTTLDVYIKGELFDTYTLPFVGDHLVLNLLSVITASFLSPYFWSKYTFPFAYFYNTLKL